jgi:hypothetical protein
MIRSLYSMILRAVTAILTSHHFTMPSSNSTQRAALLATAFAGRQAVK